MQDATMVWEEILLHSIRQDATMVWEEISQNNVQRNSLLGNH